MDESISIRNARLNMSCIIGYWHAVTREMVNKMEHLIDKRPYIIDASDKQKLIEIAEELKLTKRLSDYIWDHRCDYEFNREKFFEAYQLLKNTHKKNENGRTDSLDASAKG